MKKYKSVLREKQEQAYKWKVGGQGKVGIVFDIKGNTVFEMAYDDAEKEIRRWDDAVKYCKNLKSFGARDWFLPNLKQLRKMWALDIKKRIGDFKYGRAYWSSDEDDDGFSAYTKDFDRDGLEISVSKNNFANYVRPVRMFKI